MPASGFRLISANIWSSYSMNEIKQLLPEAPGGLSKTFTGRLKTLLGSNPPFSQGSEKFVGFCLSA